MLHKGATMTFCALCPTRSPGLEGHRLKNSLREKGQDGEGGRKPEHERNVGNVSEAFPREVFRYGLIVFGAWALDVNTVST